MADEISGSRWGRFGRLAWLSRNVVPAALGKGSAERAAAEALRTLGSMKGVALKIGQMLSYLDGVIPESHRDAFQAALGELRSRAPALSFEQIEPVLCAELGRPVAEVFRELERSPFAAASIGQVHRGVLRSGELVAVKIQYPGIDRAIAADLDNAALVQSLLLPLLGPMQANVKDVLAEVRARLLEELDYLREARMQERFRANFGDDPEIRVPRTFVSCSSRRVLTSELIIGRSLEQVAAEDSQEARDRYGAILTRAMLRSIYEFRLFNGDPHPGNYLFPADGSVVLLDFGCVKELGEWMIAHMKSYFRAAILAMRTGHGWDEFDRAIAAAFGLDLRDQETFAVYREFVLYTLRPYLRDEVFQFTPEYTGGNFAHVFADLKKLSYAGGKLRRPKLPAVPADFTFIGRLQWGFYSVLAMLRARGNWYRMQPADVIE